MNASGVAESNGIEHKTCRLVIVTPGQSDRVIRIYPAEHDAEKIWLDNTPGMERWEAVKRLLYTSAERGTRVPDPAPFHSSSKDLKTIDLKESDIPYVKLVGEVLRKPKEVETYKPQPQQAMTAGEVANRFNTLESNIAQLATAISNMAMKLIAPPVIKPQEVAAAVCKECNKSFKNEVGLRFHKGKFHKK